jgi:23S rRNA (uracil1939-C5)-methyltransferase
VPRTARLLAVDVEGIDLSGDGAAYSTVDGRRLPIDYAIPGERVEVRIATDGGEHAVAELTRVIRPSPHRVTPGCPYFGPCGGCTWQHIAQDEQRRLKEQGLRALLAQSLGKAAPRVQPTLDPATPWGFRNKVHFVLGAASHAGEGNRVAFAMRDALARARIDGATPDGRRGVARHIVVRATETPRETLATLVATRNDPGLRRVVSALLAAPGPPDGLHLNVNDRPGPYLFGLETRRLHGRQRVRETIAGVSFLISPTAFFQTNVRAAEAMVQWVVDHAGEPATALDLYAGAGLFALPLAGRGARVTAVEENDEAVDDGEASRRFNRIADTTCRFVRARAEDLAGGRARRAIPAAPDLVILDPPRAGCPANVLNWICASLRPRRIIYVSCNPQALATDLRVPLAAGYAIETVQPIDMFPHTAHIETVAVLTRL